MIGWATAWSFDRLRLWLEERIEPALAVRNTLIHLVARVALAGIFAYQGLVPKLILRHGDELSMLSAAGIPAPFTAGVLTSLGIAEIAVAVALLVSWFRSWPAWICAIAMPIATTVVALHSPMFFGAAFNPFSLNLAVVALAVIDVIVLPGVPSAARCVRRSRSEKP